MAASPCAFPHDFQSSGAARAPGTAAMITAVNRKRERILTELGLTRPQFSDPEFAKRAMAIPKIYTSLLVCRAAQMVQNAHNSKPGGVRGPTPPYRAYSFDLKAGA